MEQNKTESCILRSNSGVQNTSESALRGHCIAGLDWFEFTLWDFSVSTIIEQLLQLSVEQFTKAPGSYYGYRTKYSFLENDSITIWADGSQRRGVHVILTAQGCAYLQQLFPLEKLFTALSALCVKVTRLDLALDDKTGDWYTVAQLIDHARNGEIISYWRGCDVSTGYMLNSGLKDKAVIYMGSIHSDMSLRVYDKRLAQSARGVQLEALPEAWTRWEFCCRNEKAQAVLDQLQQEMSLNQLFAKLLSDSMRIVKADKRQTNRSRWRIRSKWQRFLPSIAGTCSFSA